MSEICRVPAPYLEDAARGLWLADQLLRVCEVVLSENRHRLTKDSRNMLETLTEHPVGKALPSTREELLCLLLGV